MRIKLIDISGRTTEVEVDENMTIEKAKEMIGQADNPLVSLGRDLIIYISYFSLGILNKMN